jgi:hypothetical protein
MRHSRDDFGGRPSKREAKPRCRRTPSSNQLTPTLLMFAIDQIGDGHDDRFALVDPNPAFLRERYFGTDRPQSDSLALRLTIRPPLDRASPHPAIVCVERCALPCRERPWYSYWSYEVAAPFINGIFICPSPDARPSGALENIRPVACASTAGPHRRLKNKREEGMFGTPD